MGSERNSKRKKNMNTYKGKKRKRIFCVKIEKKSLEELQQPTADGAPPVHGGKKVVSRPAPHGDKTEAATSKRACVKKKTEDLSSIGPTRKSPRVIPPKCPILPLEGVSVAESAISFHEVKHQEEEAASLESSPANCVQYNEEQQEDSSMEGTTDEECPLEKKLSQLEKLCRLCFMELEDFTYIFEFHEAHKFNVDDVINDLIGLDVNPNDGFPSKICNYCLEELSHFRHFKRKCFETKARLRRIVEAITNSEEDSADAGYPSVSGGREACEVPVQSEAVEVTEIKQEANLPESHQESEFRINSCQNPVPNRVEEVMVKKEIISCESANVDEVTFNEEFMVPYEPTSVHQVTVNKELLTSCKPTNVAKVTVNQELMVPYQPTCVGRVTVNKELLMTCESTSVGKVTVNRELMVPHQPTCVGRVAVNKDLMMPCQPTSVGKVTVNRELMVPHQPSSVGRVAVNKDLMMPCQPTSVGKAAVNKELMMPCELASVGKVTVNRELMVPHQPTSVAVYKQLMGPCGSTSVGYDWIGGGERITPMQDEHTTLEPTNVPCPPSCVPVVLADGLSVPMKEELCSDDEEFSDKVVGF